jgi:hypothetical protein
MEKEKIIFSEKDLEKIKNEKIFIKKIKGKSYRIKPIKDSDYKQGNINAHIKYLKILKENLKSNLPKIIAIKKKIDNKKYLILVCENIKGKIIILNSKLADNKLKESMFKLLKKGYVLDFYGKDNFIIDKNNKIYYIDARMPLFSKRSNEGNRFEISKKKTREILK